MKLFLATSISGQIDSISQAIKPEHRQFLEQILKNLRSLSDTEVFAAVEQENWRLNDVAPEVGVQADLRQIDQSDTVVALLQGGLSAGLQFEIGYAVARAKKVIMAQPRNEALAYFNQGAVSAGLVTLVTYDSGAMLIEQLGLALHGRSEPTDIGQ
jgi:nucleoside 2-deoxyribosyltransferase